MPRASKRTKKPVEVKYEPEVSHVVGINYDRIVGFSIKGASFHFEREYLTQVIDALVRIEMSEYYEKVINNAVHK